MSDQQIENGEPRVITDSEGLMAQFVEVPVERDIIPVYCAFPQGQEMMPLVLVVQEIFGIHEHIQDVCRRFAKMGCIALAPDLFFRQGSVNGLSNPEQIYPIVSQVPDQQVMQDLDATVTWALENGLADPQRMGITGFCWGGRIVWLYASINSELKAGVAWYGRLDNQVTQNQPRHPINVADDLKCSVLGLYGGQDHLIPNELVEKMNLNLSNKKKNSMIVTYPQSGHGFFADYRSSYSQKDAESGWSELLAWFRKHEILE